MATPTPLIATDAELTHGTGAITTNCHGLIFVRTGDRAYTNIRTSAYRWIASGSGTNEWYLQTAAGGNPSITDVSDRMVTTTGAHWGPRGTAGSLLEGQWDVADNDTLGYDTIYVRTFNTGSSNSPSGYTDPDSERDGSVWTSIPNTSFSWGDGNAATVREIKWEFIEDSGTTTRYGFNASHRFQSSGSVRLTITDNDGTAASTTRTVTKASYSPTDYYIDPTGGSDGNNGLTSGAAKASLSSAITAAGSTTDNVRYLIKRGETVTLAAHARIDSDNLYVGGYGTGADPILSAYSLYPNGSDVLVEGVQIAGSYANVATPQTQSRLAFIDVTPKGDMGSFMNFDRINIGMHVESCVAADLSAYGGMGSYFCYSVKRADSAASASGLGAISPLAMKAFYDCANDYGNENEAAIRVGGDYMTFTGCDIEQTNISSTLRNKSCGPRIVGGTHVYIRDCYFANDSDTSALSNAEQGTAAVTWGPADGQSWCSRWVVIEDCHFLNSNIQPNQNWGAGLTGFIDDVTIRRNKWTFPQPCFYANAIAVGTQNYAVLHRWRFVHNTIDMDKADLCRILNLYGQTGLWLDGWEVQNNLVVNPSLRVYNNDTEISMLVFFRSADAGETEFAVFKDNVYATPGTGSGSYPTNFACRYDTSAGTGAVLQTLAQVNSTFGTGNVLADTNLTAQKYIDGTDETAATTATALVSDVPRDARGYVFYTTGPVGAFSFYSSSSVNSGGGSFPVWI
jgi:hypothetical protein